MKGRSVEWYAWLKDFLERFDSNGLVGLLRALNQSPPRHATRGNFHEATVNSLLTTATHNKALRNELLKAAGIRDVDEEKLQLQQQATAATLDAARAAQASADEARRANELAAEANQIARAAQDKAKKSDLKSWLALAAALIGVATAVTKCATG